MSKIRDQFENYLRLYGPDAFPVYKAVFSIPFDDPQDVYGWVRDVIEATAEKLGIEVHRLEQEVTSPAGRARRAKSVITRRLYKRLVRRASQERLAITHPKAVAQNPSPEVQILGQMALRTNVRLDAEEYLTDAEDFFKPITPPTKPSPPASTDAPKLGFRVWDAQSKTTFSPDHGFVSEAFRIWKGPYPQPSAPPASMEN
jgi:hypothetical protein